MTSRTTDRFWRGFDALPPAVARRARESFRRFQADPSHPSLNFKKLPPHDDVWSVRISDSYRAVGVRRGSTIVWYFIGTHAEYDALIARHS